MTLKLNISEVGAEQLNKILESENADLMNAVIDACELIMKKHSQAPRFSSALVTDHGVVFQLPVVGFAPLKVFWSKDPVWIEAIFPY